MIHIGDCRAVLAELGEASVDAVVTDPPYELGFMGKAWDASGVAFQVETWRAALRVLKPGGHLLAFGGTRTYHRMTCAIEDAGFEIRDSLHWIYGTGFPKSLNLGDGRGTALKPGHEPIVLARKPLVGTVAANVERFGTGALNVDACRIGGWSALEPNCPHAASVGVRITVDMRVVCVECGLERGNPRPLVISNRAKQRREPGAMAEGSRAAGQTTLGRWPANVLLDEGAAAELDGQSGVTRSASGGRSGSNANPMSWTEENRHRPRGGHDDSGGASRFFYVAKPSRKERDLGCNDLPPRSGGEATDREDGSAGVESPRAGAGRTGGARNFHPTVKPVELMRYLVRLVTPPGGLVLDPFMGSGTTGMAALLEGRCFVGVEMSPEYAEIARLRMKAVAP